MYDAGLVFLMYDTSYAMPVLQRGLIKLLGGALIKPLESCFSACLAGEDC